jgi:alkylhydroperoxidase family enzyme
MENGLTEEKISDLDADGKSFTSREAMALEYAERLAVDHHNMDDAFFDRLKAQFSEQEILELGMMAGQYIGFGRLLMVLDLTPKFCAVDESSDVQGL